MRRLLLSSCLVAIACQPSSRELAPGSTAPAAAPVTTSNGAEPLGARLPGAMGFGDRLGTGHRVISAIGDPSARWAVLCQQRDDTNGDGAITFEQEQHFALGDRPSPWLVIGGGTGQRIDDVLATSPDGNWLVVVANQAPLLVDVVGSRVHALAADTVLAAFTGDGRRLVYATGPDLRRPGQLIRRELASHAEHAVVRPGGGLVAGLVTDHRGQWVALLGDEPDGPGPGWCSLGSLHHPTSEPPRWVELDTGIVLDEPTLLRPLGTRRLTRQGPATVVFDGAPLGPRDCVEMDVLGVHEPSDGVLVYCRRDEGPSSVHYAVNGTVRVEVEGFPTRQFARIPPTLDEPFCFYSGQGPRCLDLATATLARATSDAVNRSTRFDAYVTGIDHMLVRPADGEGLRWEPRPR